MNKKIVDLNSDRINFEGRTNKRPKTNDLLNKITFYKGKSDILSQYGLSSNSVYMSKNEVLENKTNVKYSLHTDFYDKRQQNFDLFLMSLFYK